MPWEMYSEHSHSKPTWRLVVWGKNQGNPETDFIKDVVECESLATLLSSYAPWRVVPFAKNVEEAIKAIGRKSIDSTRSDCQTEGPEWALRIYEDSIRIQRKRGPEPGNWDNNEVRQWNYQTKVWEVVS